MQYSEKPLNRPGSRSHILRRKPEQSSQVGSSLTTADTTLLQSTRYFAVAPKGFEDLTAKELEAIGAKNIEPAMSGVYFEGDREVLYRANYNLRTASRILMAVREFSAKSEIMFYDQLKRMRWEELISPD